MSNIEVTMTQLRQGLGELVNRAAYGGERVILVSHGAPRAAIISIEDLRRLSQIIGQELSFSYDENALAERYSRGLAAADAVQERIRQWQEEQGIQPLDSTELLRELREERDDEILGLR